MLARPELEQLAQRVIARFHLEPLTEIETAHYIKHRLSVAGMSGLIPFDRDARKRIHELSRGVPRRINLLCDRALLGAYATSRERVNKEIVDKAAREVFDIDDGGAATHLPRKRDGLRPRPGCRRRGGGRAGAGSRRVQRAPRRHRCCSQNPPHVASRQRDGGSVGRRVDRQRGSLRRRRHQQARRSARLGAAARQKPQQDARDVIHPRCPAACRVERERERGGVRLTPADSGSIDRPPPRRRHRP
jgi:hypothetical protein